MEFRGFGWKKLSEEYFCYPFNMVKAIVIQLADHERIEVLMKKIGASTKTEVIRAALTLLEAQVDRVKRVRRWESAARLAADSSYEVLLDFRSVK